MTELSSNQSQPVSPATQAPKGEEKIAFGLTAIILAAVAIIFCWIPIFNWLLVIAALVGLVLGIIGIVKNKNNKKVLAIIGTSLSGVAALLTLFMAIVMTMAMILAIDAADDEDYGSYSYSSYSYDDSSSTK